MVVKAAVPFSLYVGRMAPGEARDRLRQVGQAPARAAGAKAAAPSSQYALADISLRGAFGVLDSVSPRDRRGASAVIVSDAVR